MFVWNIDPDLFHLPAFLGGRGIRYYGVLFALALMGSFYLWQRQVMRVGRSKEEAEKFLTISVIATILGARLGHCFFYEPARYLKDPISIIKFWQGGLASHGASLGLIIGIIYYSRKYKMGLEEAFDRFAMPVAFTAAMVRLGNFMNSEIVGRVTDLPWKVKFPRHDRRLLDLCDQCGQVASDVCTEISGRCYSLAQVPWRHPSQLYEAAMAFSILGILYLVDRKYGEKRPLGLMAAIFCFTYFSARFLVEFVKEYQSLESGGLTMGQFLSLPFIIAGIIWFVRVFTRLQAEKAA